MDDDDGDEELVYIGHQVTVDGEDFIIGVVAVAVTDGDTAPYFLDGDTTTRSILENSPAGTDVGEPIAAGDAEGGTLTYSVAGDDASFFSLDTANGQLSVASGVSFDYENPGDRDSGNDYEVTLTVTDPDNETDTIDVTVSINNDPEGALWSSRFTLGSFTTFVGAGNLFTGVAVDPDRFEYGGINAPIIDIYLDTSDGTLNFCLDGSLSSYRNEGWSLYADGTAFAFSDSTLAEAVDKDCYSWANSGLSWVDGDTVAMALGDPATVGNVDLPPDAPTALRVAPEAGDPNGSLSIAWTDPYNAGRPPITDYDVRYRIAGTEAWTGVTNTPITSSPLTLPGLAAGTSYDVQIRAVNTRGAGGWSSSGAGRTGTDGNDPPYFLAADAPDAEIAEDAALGDLVGAPVAAADPDSTDTLTYALSGAGSANFDIDGGGQITVASRATLDHETTPSYFFSVAVHDGKDADGNDDTTIDDTITVTINVTNIEEPGEVTFSWEQPQVDTVLTATLEDPDGGVTNLTRQWAKSADGSNNWTNIGGATSASYTPVDGDAGNYLRATASYDDLLGMGRSAAGVTDSGVHNAPSFAEGASTTRTVAENTADIDSPVTATDEGGDTLAYTLSGTDQAAFSIDVYSGQLTAANGLGLDYETATDSDGDNSYDVLVTASEIDRYDRRNWDHWNDADDDCQDARQEVLIAESEVAVTYEDDRNCRVETGQWTGAFTGTVVTSPGILDIDHFVPLANAWKSGAWAWDDARKEEYANYLDDPDHLIAVTRGANRSKGARGPEAWKPPLESFHCEYATRWTNIKARWELSVTAGEQEALDEMIATCATEPTLPALTTRAAATAGQDGSATIDVSVTVTNVDEAGTVTLDSTQPQVGTALTASLTDPDGTVSGESWQWSSSSDQNAWANIVGATLASYTPVSGDVGNYLRATVSYTDGHGDSKSAQADAADAVQTFGIAFSPPGPITLTEGAGETAFTVTVTNVPGITYLLGGLYDGGTSSADFSITDSQGNEFSFDTDSDVEFIIGLDESTIGSGTFAWTFNMSAIEDNVDEAPEEIDLYFRIVVAGGLESTYSNDVQVTIVDNDGPSQPTGLTATACDTQVRLSWDDPADSSFTKYQYQETAGGVEGSWEDIPASAPGETNARSFIKRGLTNGTEYSYVIRGVIADADGLQSDAAAATPVAATSVPDQPGNFTAEQNGIRRVSLEWDASASPLTIAGYQLTEDGGSEWTAIPDSHSGTASWTVTGLANGATYNFSVRAVNGADNSDAADAATVTVVARPARPAGFAATPQNGQVWLTWDDPENDSITRWEYWTRKGSDTAEGWKAVPGSDVGTTSYLVTDLDNGQVYRFRLRAVNLAGTSDNTGLQAATPNTDRTNGPLKPRGLTAVAEAGQVTLSWLDPNDSSIEGYEVSQDGTWSAISGGGANTTEHTVTNLTNGTSYTFRVRGRNEVGTSPESDSVTILVGNTAPAFDSGDSVSLSVDENTGVGGNVGSAVTATDANNDTLTYSLSGTDAGSFAIGNDTSQITVGTGTTLDYESGATSYSVMVEVHDGADAGGNADTTVDDAIMVTINVTNVDEAGTVTLDSAQPKVGTVVTASLTDPDGTISSESWQWANSADGTDGSWTNISGATSASYTPVDGDVGDYLRATVSYTDPEGSGKPAQADAANAVEEAAVTLLCTNGTVVPDPDNNADLVADCRTLLSLMHDLRGTAELNWSGETAITDWDGITVGGTPQRVRRLELDTYGPDGTIPTELGSLTNLTRLNLSNNDLNGSIPTELGNLTSLATLELQSNDLNGSIPTELGSLTSLRWLYLGSNDLTGSIPTELGSLTALRGMFLQDNNLIGAIPTELGSLMTLNLSNNELSGAIPTGLGSLTSLNTLYLWFNNLTGSVSVDLSSLNDLRLDYPENVASAITTVSASGLVEASTS